MENNNFFGEIEDYLDQWDSPSGEDESSKNVIKPIRNLAEKRKLETEDTLDDLGFVTSEPKNVKLDEVKERAIPVAPIGGGILAQALLERRPTELSDSNESSSDSRLGKKEETVGEEVIRENPNVARLLLQMRNKNEPEYNEESSTDINHFDQSRVAPVRTGPLYMPNQVCPSQRMRFQGFHSQDTWNGDYSKMMYPNNNNNTMMNGGMRVPMPFAGDRGNNVRPPMNNYGPDYSYGPRGPNNFGPNYRRAPFMPHQQQHYTNNFGYSEDQSRINYGRQQNFQSSMINQRFGAPDMVNNQRYRFPTNGEYSPHSGYGQQQPTNRFLRPQQYRSYFQEEPIPQNIQQTPPEYNEFFDYSWKSDCVELRKNLLENLRKALTAQDNPNALSLAEKVESEAFKNSESQGNYVRKLVEWLAGIYSQASVTAADTSPDTQTSSPPASSEEPAPPPPVAKEPEISEDGTPKEEGPKPSSPTNSTSTDTFTSPPINFNGNRRPSGKGSTPTTNPHSVDSGIGSPRSITSSLYSPKIPQGTSPSLLPSSENSPDK